MQPLMRRAPSNNAALLQAVADPVGDCIIEGTDCPRGGCPSCRGQRGDSAFYSPRRAPSWSSGYSLAFTASPAPIYRSENQPTAAAGWATGVATMRFWS
eukprot:scaffold72272_cov63-Phaeocystis_antarctica.AAC.2